MSAACNIDAKARRLQRQLTAAERLAGMVMSFSRRSTIHGLNHIAQARSARRRIFWMLIFTAASCGFMVNLYHISEKYLQVPVLTNVKHDHLSFTFPDITICNINPIFFPPKGSRHFAALKEEIELFKEKVNSALAAARNLTGWKQRYLMWLATRKVKVADYLYTQRNVSLYSIPRSMFVQDCRYMGKQSHCHREWITHRRWPYGACYQLNITSKGRKAISTENRKAYSSGFRPDLFLLLYKGVDYPQQFSFMDPHGTIKMPSGVLLMLHEPGTYPQIGESFPLDKYAQLDLHMTRKRHLRKLKLCASHRDMYKYVDIETGQTRLYRETRTDCVENISQTAYKRHCGCVRHEFPLKYNDADFPFCTDFDWFAANFSDLKCIDRQKVEVEAANPLRTCYKDLCEHTSYSTVISQANFPAVAERKTHLGWLEQLRKMELLEVQLYGVSDLAEKALLLNESTRGINISEAHRRQLGALLNVDFVERNFMYLRVVPSSMFADDLVEDEEYPMSRFLTDVGGCVGLWVGASLITVFEFCDLILDFLGLEAIFRGRSRRARCKQNGISHFADKTSAAAAAAASPGAELLRRATLELHEQGPDSSSSCCADVQLGMISTV